MTSIHSTHFCAAALAALAVSCGSNNQNNGDRQTAPYGQLRQEESAAERREFIAAQREELDELGIEIARMDARLQHEGQYVDAEQRAEWSQELFELRQRQTRARAELERAQNATPAEWAAMRGALGNAVDSLQAGVGKLAGEMGDLFESNGATARQATERGIDLCQMGADVMNAELVEEEEKLIVRLTSNDQQSVEKLREQAERWEHRGSASAGSMGTHHDRAAAGEGQAAVGENSRPLIEDVSVEDIQQGVRLTITPAEGQRAQLKEQLSTDIEQLRAQQC